MKGKLFTGYKWEYERAEDETVTMLARNEKGEIIASHRNLIPVEVEEILTAEARAMRIRAEHWLKA